MGARAHAEDTLIGQNCATLHGTIQEVALRTALSPTALTWGQRITHPLAGREAKCEEKEVQEACVLV